MRTGQLSPVTTSYVSRISEYCLKAPFGLVYFTATDKRNRNLSIAFGQRRSQMKLKNLVGEGLLPVGLRRAEIPPAQPLPRLRLLH